MEPPLLTHVLPSGSISLDHFIRPIQNGRWNRDAELLGRLEINDKLEPLGPLYGKVARVRALEDLVYISGRAPEQIWNVYAVRHKTTGINKSPTKIDCRQLVPSGKINNLLLTGYKEGRKSPLGPL